VVCGAWHVPALDIDAPSTPNATADAATLRCLSKVKTAVAWVPWTHRRLVAASGYAAGVDSPGWYRHVFEHPGSDGVARFFVDAARLLRDRGGAASPDDLIAGTRLAESLAAMRGRPRVGLAEVLDAADAVMGGLEVLRRELVVGDEIGSVPESAPQVPLARDVARAQKSARLPPRAETSVLEVDLRAAAGLAKSRLLHRLAAVDVAWGVVVEGRGTTGTFRETWALQWDPELSVRLVERAGYGTTLESAATARLLERAAASSGIVELVNIIGAALLADLPLAVGPSVARLASRAAVDPDVGRLLDALPALADALRYGDVRSTDVAALREVVDGIVVRILAGLVASAHALDDDGAHVADIRLGHDGDVPAQAYRDAPAVIEAQHVRGGRCAHGDALGDLDVALVHPVLHHAEHGLPGAAGIVGGERVHEPLLDERVGDLLQHLGEAQFFERLNLQRNAPSHKAEAALFAKHIDTKTRGLGQEV